MKTLLFTIFIAVFSLCQLFIPDYFEQTEGLLPTAQAELLGEMSGGIVHPAEVPQTPTETKVPSPTATPAPVSKDPQSVFGDPKAEETFERGSTGFGLNAGLNDDENIRIIAIDNKLTLVPKKNNGWLSWRLRPPVIQDGAVEMDFSITTCARGDRTGIIMHAPDYTEGHGYYFNLACEGTVSIMRDTTQLGSASATEVFNNGSGDVNTMTAMILGDTLTLSLNGQELLSVQDNALPEGYSGFFTAPQVQDTLRLDVLSFKEYY